MLLIKGKLYPAIKVGDLGDWYHGHEGCTCGDCGMKYGEAHIPGCDIERCPRCGGQIISCNCGVMYDVESTMSDLSLKQLIEEQRKQNERDEEMIL